MAANQQQIADALREYLLTKEPSQREVARKLGKSPAHISNYLRGSERISRAVADKIVELWPEIRLAFLLSGDGPLLNAGAVQIQNVDRSPNSTILQAGRDAEVAMLREQLDREREARSRAEAQVADLTGIIANLTKK